MAERPEEQLFNVLRTTFSLEDLRTLSFQLGVDDDGLRQDNRDVLARELIIHMRKTGRLDELVERVRRERPNIPWPGAPPVAPGVRTLVVDALHRGDYTTISTAIAAAQPGYLIKIRPGIYNEGIVIDKPLEIAGDGPVEEIIVRAGGNVIKTITSHAIVRNLTLRQAGGNSFGVDIAQGYLVLEGCDICSEGLSCVYVHNGAMATIRRNRIHDGKTIGVSVRHLGWVIIEENDIVGNDYAGIQISDSSTPTVRRNRIYNGKRNGISIHAQGGGVIEGNDIAGNSRAGIEIAYGGAPMVLKNQIRNGGDSGICIRDRGGGIIEDNDITGNAIAGISVEAESNPTVRRNRIHRNRCQAIQVFGRGAGTFEGNDLRDNTGGAWDITDSSRSLVNRSNNIE